MTFIHPITNDRPAGPGTMMNGVPMYSPVTDSTTIVPAMSQCVMRTGSCHT